MFTEELLEMNEEKIIACLADIIDPDNNKPVTTFIKKVVMNDGVVVFALEYEGLSGADAIARKEELRAKCVRAVEQLDGVKEVKIAITSNRGAEAPAVKQKMALPSVDKIIVVASGKGGVGKSTVATNLAITLMNMGHKVGLLDADIYGPSMPKLFDLQRKPVIKDDKLQPLIKYGLQLMSVGFLVAPEEAVVWRGPMVSKALHQLLRFTSWSNLDYLIIDTPPGTGDIHLSLAENYVIDGAVVVTTPQQLSTIDAQKAVSMFGKLSIPVLGVIENMSCFMGADNKPVYIFGHGGGKLMAKKNDVPFLGEIPLMPEIVETSDSGKPITYFGKNKAVCTAFNQIAEVLCKRL